MAKTKLHEKAIKLRTLGKSIRDISRMLSVSKSTASYWCRDILLSEKAISALTAHQRSKSVEALLRFAEHKRKRRVIDTLTFQRLGRKDLGRLTKRDRFMIGLALYWGEGYKRGSQETGFTNSDPDMIKFFITWVAEQYDIPKTTLILRVSINAIHKTRVADVEKYWSKLINIPLSQFTKTSLIQTKAKKKYSNHSIHFGTLRVKVRNGTNLRRRILGSIAAIR